MKKLFTWIKDSFREDSPPYHPITHWDNPKNKKHSNKSKPIIHKLIDWIDSFLEGSPQHWLNNRENSPSYKLREYPPSYEPTDSNYSHTMVCNECSSEFKGDWWKKEFYELPFNGIELHCGVCDSMQWFYREEVHYCQPVQKEEERK